MFPNIKLFSNVYDHKIIPIKKCFRLQNCSTTKVSDHKMFPAKKFSGHKMFSTTKCFHHIKA